ncbi:MAG TPA: argininosuccinate lyase [Thermoanaerobaculia bacterium]|nr:argininosuccinate lyase [Thermoanaerobaculia bacterium]
MTKNPIWGGRFEGGPSDLLRAFNDSFSFDAQLFAEDVEGSIAWTGALERAGVLSRDEAAQLSAALRRVPAPEVFDEEDVHSYVESKLRPSIGALAGKLHTGRSRNDQVATDLKLWLKKACDAAVGNIRALATELSKRASEESSTPMPGYTHSKQAEPVTFGHWCLAYCEMLLRDISRFESAKLRGDECPLGCGALAGTPLEIDRDALAKSLGFARATANSIDGVSDRDFAAEYLFASALLLSHLSRLAEDLIFFTSDEANYAELPDALATGSSRMPQKKNPDVLELVRGHAGRAIGDLTGLLAVMKGIPLAYDKDLQLDKEPLFRMRATLAAALPALAALIGGLKLNRDRMRAAARSPMLLATAVADAIAANGTPFREAHERVGRELASIEGLAKEHGVTLESILAKKSAFGGTSPERVKEAAHVMPSRVAGEASQAAKRKSLRSAQGEER